MAGKRQDAATIVSKYSNVKKRHDIRMVIKMKGEDG